MQLVTEDNITDLAVERWATAKDPRLAEIMTAFVRHLHDFAREVRLTEAEWMAAIQWVNRTGGIVNLTDAIGIDDGAVATRLHALGFSDPGPIHGYQLYADGTSYDQAVMPGRGGWTLVSTSGSANDVFGLIMQDGQDHLWAVNG